MSDIMATPPQPVNYTGLQIQPDPVGNFLKASQAQANIGLLGAQTQQAQGAAGLLGAQTQQVQQVAQGLQLANQRQQNFADQWKQFSANPTPQGAVQMAMANPEWSTQIQSTWNGYNEQQRQQKLDMISPVMASLQNNRPDLATNLLEQHARAIQNTPGYENDQGMQQDLAGTQNMLKIIAQDPKQALAYVYATSAAAQGPQDFMTHVKQAGTLPADVAAAQYQPAAAAADVAVKNSQAQDLQSMIQNRAAQFGLDQNRLQAEVQFKLRQMNYEQNAPSMAPTTRAQADQDATDSVVHGQMAERLGTLAQNVGVLNQQGQWVSGKPEDVRAGWQNFWGNQDQLNTVRTEYQQVMGTVGGFGGAGLTDSDKKTLSQGFPAKNADPDQIQSFLQSFQNASLRAARMSDAKSSWAYSFGRLGPATQDADVGGIQVAKGTTFPAFMKQMLATGSQAPSPYAAPNASPGVQINQQGGQQPAQGGASPTFTGGLSYLNQYVGGQ